MSSQTIQPRMLGSGLGAVDVREPVRQQPGADANELDRRVEGIQALIGRPTYCAPGIRLFNGDSLELMRDLVDHGTTTVDLTVTSPPYNIGKEYETPMTIPDYIAWSEEWIRSVFQITAPNGAFWLNLGYMQLAGRGKAIPLPYILWDKIPFYLLQEIVWNYGAGVAARKTFSPRNEKFMWYVKNSEKYTFNLDDIRDPNVKYPNSKKKGKIRTNPLGKNPTDVWQIPKVTSGKNRSSRERTEHPAQFPIAVIERIIKGCSNPGDLVFDPFMGSGTVAEVCLRHGRACIGIEIEPRYVEIASKRLESARAELKLF